MRDAAQALLEAGLVPIPVAYKGKLPSGPDRGKGWQQTRRETVHLEAFDARTNIGVVLGEPSGWVVDVDLDCREAIDVAPWLMLSTRYFGRESAPRSHYIYRAVNAETAKHYDPIPYANGDRKKAMIVELRSTGCQSVFPPSTHESGEVIAYESDSEEAPADIAADSLLAMVRQVAAAALFRRYAGLEVEDAAAHARDRRIPDGLPDVVAERCREWLGIAAAAPAPAPPRTRAPRVTDVMTRARAYLARIPGAVAGNGGHDQTYDAALALVRGFDLDEGTALTLLEQEYNPRCDPPWSARELEHKIRDAANSPKAPPLGYLLERELPAPVVPIDSARRPASETDGNAAINTATQSAFRPWRARSYLTAYEIISQNARDVLDGRKLRYDEMSGNIMYGDRLVHAADVSRIRANIEARFVGGLDKKNNEIGLQLAIGDVERAVEQVAHDNPFHPVREYLAGLKWDGVPRIEDVAQDVLGAENTEINRIIIRKWFVSAAARALQPGCKVDTVLVLVGEQGARKSSFFRELAAPWFVDTPVDIDRDAVRAYMTLRTAWILEFAELDSLLRARDQSSIKAFFSSQVDSYTPKHARYPVSVPRMGVIVGTWNPDEQGFLADPTGERRYHPITVGRIDLDILRAQRDQLWAEAVALYHQGGEAPWWLTEDESKLLAPLHEEHRKRDEWSGPVLDWLERHPDVHEVSVAHLLEYAIGLERDRWEERHSKRVQKVLRDAGWRVNPNKAKGKPRAWKRPGNTGGGDM